MYVTTYKLKLFSQCAYVGSEEDAFCQRCKNSVTLNWPVQGGVIVNWDYWEKLFHHGFYNVMRVSPQGTSRSRSCSNLNSIILPSFTEHLFLLTEKSWNSREARERTTVQLMETCKLQPFHILFYLISHLYHL